MDNIQMVDLKGQYQKIRTEIDQAILQCVADTTFINGPQVREFSATFGRYLDDTRVIPCANGTDALQIAMMALNLKRGDEIIIPAFTYVATAEVIGLLGLTPVMVDVDPETFNITAEAIEAAITERTRAIVPVHLFGQCADMESILTLCRKHQLYIIEDTAQAIGADYRFADGRKAKAGTLGDIGCTSFFPSKNLGCYGDGGACYTASQPLAARMQMIANHGQQEKYVHKTIGINSRLDSIQAAILNVKLPHLNKYILTRQRAAAYYDSQLAAVEEIITPLKRDYSSHVYHQYTLKVKGGKRNALKKHLQENGIPAMIYYPVPLNKQEAYLTISAVHGELPVTEMLCSSVLSLPMHTELDEQQQSYIVNSIKKFFAQ